MIEQLGIALDSRGNVAANANYMTSVEGIFAAAICAAASPSLSGPSRKDAKPPPHRQLSRHGIGIAPATPSRTGIRSAHSAGISGADARRFPANQPGDGPYGNFMVAAMGPMHSNSLFVLGFMIC